LARVVLILPPRSNVKKVWIRYCKRIALRFCIFGKILTDEWWHTHVFIILYDDGIPLPDITQLDDYVSLTSHTGTFGVDPILVSWASLC
jgi:hypothetical protein